MGWTAWEKVPDLEFTDIIYEKKFRTEGGGVARVTINRTQVLNAFTDHTTLEIGTALYDASHDPMVGVVVLTGAGDQAFSTGGDVNWEASGGTRMEFFGNPRLINDYVRSCRKPLIAAVKGYAIGGGHHLAYCCDFTLAADNAVFGQNGPRIGSPADGWYVTYLTRVVGAKKAREIWMFARRYTAQEALQMGLVNKVVPLNKLDEEVDRWCEEILSLCPPCIEILKTAFDSDIDYLRVQSGQWTNLMHPDVIDSPEVKEAQQAFMEKRAPDFWKVRKQKE